MNPPPIFSVISYSPIQILRCRKSNFFFVYLSQLIHQYGKLRVFSFSTQPIRHLAIPYYTKNISKTNWYLVGQYTPTGFFVSFSLVFSFLTHLNIAVNKVAVHLMPLAFGITILPDPHTFFDNPCCGRHIIPVSRLICLLSEAF